MKTRSMFRLIVALSVVLFCLGVGVYSYLRLQSVVTRRSFNLYSLVPADAVAVMQTDCLSELVSDIDGMACSREGHFLHTSTLFNYLKTYLQPVADEVPHGLSASLNRVLISFHEPQDSLGQVLYFAPEKGDERIIQQFVNRFGSGRFPSKEFIYKGQQIRIFPLENGLFLSAYVTRQFIALSFEKRLVEQVIDARRNHQTLLTDARFTHILKQQKGHVEAIVYLRMQVAMGRDNGETLPTSALGGWTEFSVKLSERTVYVSGISSLVDSTSHTLLGALRSQRPVEGFCGELLPASTVFFNRCALDRPRPLLDFLSRQVYREQSVDADVRSNDSIYSEWLCNAVDADLITCFFCPESQSPSAILSFSLHDAVRAERKLRSFTPALRRAYVGGIVCYRLQANTLLQQFSGIVAEGGGVAAIYRDRLLLAPDVADVRAYVNEMERKSSLSGNVYYAEGIANLSPTYTYAMLADMGALNRFPDRYLKLIPRFFFTQPDFFGCFSLGFQISYTDEAVSPNIVLHYRD